MRRNSERWLIGGLSPLLWVLAVGAQPSAEAEQAVSATSLSDYADTAWNGTLSVLTAPARWDGAAWLEFGGATTAVVGTAVLLDQPIRDAAQRNRGGEVEHFANNFERFGAEYSFGVLGAFYLDGWVAENDRAKLVAEDGLTASIVSGGITYALKEALGRNRPDANRGRFHFSPFSGNAAFPSGHATQAFAVASVVAAHYDDDLWVDITAYGVASLVGMARIDHNAHFASDVLAGALIGTAIGRGVVHYRALAHKPISLAPVVAPQWTGLVVTASF